MDLRATRISILESYSHILGLARAASQSRPDFSPRKTDPGTLLAEPVRRSRESYLASEIFNRCQPCLALFLSQDRYSPWTGP